MCVLQHNGGGDGVMGDNKGLMGIGNKIEVEGALGAANCSLLPTGSLDSSPLSRLAVVK